MIAGAAGLVVVVVSRVERRLVRDCKTAAAIAASSTRPRMSSAAMRMSSSCSGPEVTVVTVRLIAHPAASKEEEPDVKGARAP